MKKKRHQCRSNPATLLFHYTNNYDIGSYYQHFPYFRIIFPLPLLVEDKVATAADMIGM